MLSRPPAKRYFSVTGKTNIQNSDRSSGVPGSPPPEAKQVILPQIPTVQQIADALRRQKATLATAESCTGGLLGALVTAVPGASEYYLGGVVSYDNRIKEQLLQVSSSTLIAHGAVSRSCVQEMAKGVCQLIGATYGIAISGIAGPSGGTAAKPIGTVHFAVAYHGDRDGNGQELASCTAGQILQPGGREEIRWAAAEAALGLLLQVINQR